MFCQSDDWYLNLLKKEIRLHFFYPFEIQEEDNKPVTIQTKNYLFYGYEQDSFQSTNHSDYDSEENQKSYIGILFFCSGQIYIGEYDSQFKQKNDGMLFFGIGAVLRGTFQKGFVNGSSFLSLPNNKYLYMNFLQGNFVNEVFKINPFCNTIKKYKFVQGRFQEYAGQEKFDIVQFKKISNYLPSNFIPDDIKDYSTSCYFGSFLMEDKSIYFGFIKDGKPQGWGLQVFYNQSSLNDTFFCTEDLSWVFRNFEDSENDGYILKKTFDNQVIYYYKKLEEFGVYYQESNTFRMAQNSNNKVKIQEKEYQGIPMQLKTFFEKNFDQYKDKQLESDRHISQMIFNLQNCQEILIFYLYGNLKGNVNEIYDDNLDIQNKSSFKEPQSDNQDDQDPMQSLPDINFSKLQQNQHLSQKTVSDIKKFAQPLIKNQQKMMKEARRRQSSQSNHLRQIKIQASQKDIQHSDQKQILYRQNFEEIKQKILKMETEISQDKTQIFQIDETLREDNQINDEEKKSLILKSQSSSKLKKEEKDIKKDKSVQIKKAKKQNRTNKEQKKGQKQKTVKKLTAKKKAIFKKIFEKMEMIHDKEDIQNFCSTFKTFNQYLNQQ